MTRTAVLVSALAALVLAWLASNGPWADAAPQPVPAVLQQRPVTVAAERNAFQDLQAVEAPVAADGRNLPWPQGPLWQCQPARDNCAKAWAAQPELLRGWLSAVPLLAQRCEAIARADALDEVAAPWDGPAAARPLPRLAPLSNCARLLGVQAVLAATPAEAMARLALADRLGRQALHGARSLLVHSISLTVLRSNWLMAADLLTERGWDGALLLPLLAPLPPEDLSPRAWVPHEADFSRRVMRDLGHPTHGCQAALDEGWLSRQFCRWRIGLMPEQTAQDIDAAWLARLATLPAQGPPACEVLLAPPWTPVPDSDWLAWRNTAGRLLLSTARGAFANQAAGALDLDLLRQTLHARLSGAALPAGVEVDGERFAGCQARLDPESQETRLRLAAR